MSLNNQDNQIVERIKEVVEKGNQRHLIVKNADGRVLVDLSVTVSVIIGIVAFFIPVLAAMLFIGFVIAAFAKFKIEIVHTLGDDDHYIQM